jgi:hypothetical protein
MGFFGGAAGITLGATTITGGTTGKFLYDAAGVAQEGNLFQGTNIIEQRNGTNPQNLYLYGTYTDASNYERLEIKYNQAVGQRYEIQAVAAGTGAVRNLNISGAIFQFVSTGGLNIVTSGVGTDWTFGIFGSAHLIPFTTAVSDLGSSTKAVRNIYTSSFIKTSGKAISALTAAATAGAGARDFVTDALAPTFGATVAAGGAVNVPVYSDGTNWKVG